MGALLLGIPSRGTPPRGTLSSQGQRTGLEPTLSTSLFLSELLVPHKKPSLDEGLWPLGPSSPGPHLGTGLHPTPPWALLASDHPNVPWKRVVMIGRTIPSGIWANEHALPGPEGTRAAVWSRSCRGPRVSSALCHRSHCLWPFSALLPTIFLPPAFPPCCHSTHT